MKVTLVSPPTAYCAARWEEGALAPLGLGYLAAYLTEHGIECEIIDAAALRWRQSDLKSHLIESAPDVVGVTMTSENRFAGFDSIRVAREALPEALIVAGGPHVSAAAEDTLRHLPELDIAVRGEGEETLLDVVRRFEGGTTFEGTPGISHRVGSEIFHGMDRPMIRDLDALPFPARNLLNMDLYKVMVDVPGVGPLRAQNIMASRGCPFNCSFCATPRTWGRRYRARSAENVLAEIDELVARYEAQAIWIFDDTFTVDKRRTAEICEGLIRRHPGIKWFCEIRVDTVDFELLKLMTEAGCYCVAFGVESGSQRIIDESIGKRIRLEQVDQVVGWCKALGLQYNPFMILSHPDETEEDAKQSRALVRKWNADGAHVSMAIMHVYPGTRIETIAREKGIIPPDFSWALEEDARRVPMLPSEQGQVPIFLDKLSWEFISDALFEWAEMQNYSVLRRIPRAVRSIRSVSDMKRYWTMLRTYVARKRRMSNAA